MNNLDILAIAFILICILILLLNIEKIKLGLNILDSRFLLFLFIFGAGFFAFGLTDIILFTNYLNEIQKGSEHAGLLKNMLSPAIAAGILGLGASSLVTSVILTMYKTS